MTELKFAPVHLAAIRLATLLACSAFTTWVHADEGGDQTLGVESSVKLPPQARGNPPSWAGKAFRQGVVAVANPFDRELFENLLAGQSLADAFTPDQSDGQAAFTLDGDPAMTLATGPIVNRSFEVQSGFLASVAGFTVAGDGRIIGNLGITTPTDGVRMALVSTGLGLTTQSGSFSQEVCLPPLPPGKTTMKIEYDWNFFSEEFLEYCGSQYQDFFQVSFGDTVLQSTKVDDLCNEGGLIHDDVAFDKGDVYRTGWRTQSVDVTALAGTTATLAFAAGDVGDSIYDTVILVDNARIVTE